MTYSLTAHINELARRARIGNSQAHRHAVRVMKQRQQKIGGSRVV